MQIMLIPDALVRHLQCTISERSVEVFYALKKPRGGRSHPRELEQHLTIERRDTQFAATLY